MRGGGARSPAPRGAAAGRRQRQKTDGKKDEGGKNDEDDSDSSDEGEHADETEEQRVRELALKLSMRMNGVYVEKAELLSYLEEIKRQQDNFTKLPFSIAFFALFVVSVLSREKLSDSSAIQRELRAKVKHTGWQGNDFTSGHRELDDMQKREDFYTYMRDAYLTVFMKELPVEQSELHRVARYNQLIGGVRIQQVRRKKVPCTVEYPNLGPFPSAGRANPILENFACYPWQTESDDCFGPWNDTARDDLPGGFCPDSKKSEEEAYGIRRRLLEAIGGGGRDHERRLGYVPHGGGTGGSSKGASDVLTQAKTFSVYLYEHDGYDGAVEKIDQLEANKWIDYNTAWVGLSALALNPDLAIFVRVTMHIYFPPSGALLPHVTAESFVAQPYQSTVALAADAGWAFLLLSLTFSLFMKVYKASKGSKLPDLIKSIWTWLHIFMVLGGFGILGCVAVINGAAETVKMSALEVRKSQPSVLYVSANYPRLVEQLHEDMSSLGGSLDAIRLYYSWYTILISMAFLESFAAQPRLAVVTDTIYRAGSDLFHFMVVMFIIFLSYCVAGMFLFGRRIWQFSSMQYTISTCFRIMLGDDALWADLGTEFPAMAGLWFWSFMIIMTMLMMNMLMAIIMDVYTEVKADAGLSMTVFEQVSHMLFDSMDRVTGRRLSIGQLIERIKDIQRHDLNLEVLVRDVEGISEEQAFQILTKAQELAEDQLHKGITISKAMRIIGWVKETVRKMSAQLDEVYEAEKDERDLMLEAMDDKGGPKEGLPEDTVRDTGVYAAEAEQRLEKIQQRMEKMEEFMNQAMEYTNFRGKDLRNRLALIEDLIRGQRDATLREAERTVWEAPAPKLGGKDGEASI